MEEDIKILEEEIKRVHKINDLSGTYVPIHILETLLKRYKELEEDNKELGEKLKNSIPISVIQKDLEHMKNAKPEDAEQFYMQQGITNYLEKLLKE